jgi:hypothetical protein
MSDFVVGNQYARIYVNLEHRLIANSVVDPDTGCWIWTGCLSKKGYARITLRINGVPRGKWAHVISYEVFIGPVPDGFELHHKCETECCIHPNHLQPMLPIENLKLRRW